MKTEREIDILRDALGEIARRRDWGGQTNDASIAEQALADADKAKVESAEDDGKKKARGLVELLERQTSDEYCISWQEAIDEAIFHIKQIFNLGE